MLWNSVLRFRKFSSYRSLQLRFLLNHKTRKDHHEASISRLCYRDLNGAMSRLQHLMETGHSPSQALLSSLLRSCHQPPENTAVLNWVNEYLVAHNITPNEQLGSTLVWSRLYSGNYLDAKMVFEQMVDENIRVRQSSVVGLLDEALKHKDILLANKLLLQLRECLKSVPEPALSQKVVQVAQSTGNSELVHQLLAAYRSARLPMNPELGRELESWANGQPYGYIASETTIDVSGVCQECGEQLEENAISKEERHRLLQHVNCTITQDAESFECNRSQLSQLKIFRELVSKRGPFTAVLDGSNIAHYQAAQPSVSTLKAVAREALRVFGAPLLLVARKYLSRLLRTERQALQSALEGITFHTVENVISDDYYFLYGCLASGHNSFFLSNDQLGDYHQCLPSSLKPLFEQWQESRQVAVVRKQGRIKLQLPVKYSVVVQWTESGWHLPIKKKDCTITWYCMRKTSNTHASSLD